MINADDFLKKENRTKPTILQHLENGNVFRICMPETFSKKDNDIVMKNLSRWNLVFLACEIVFFPKNNSTRFIFVVKKIG